MSDLHARTVELLRRYRNETPLGHQPHMIAHEADAILAEHDAAAPISKSQAKRVAALEAAQAGWQEASPKLERWGLPTKDLSAQQCDDGYWTPWHVAQAWLDELYTYTVPASQSALKPIERDEDFDRTYISLPGGWEVQTKGKGSSFRICDTKDGDRLLIPPSPYLHETLERMAKEIHAACGAPVSQPVSAANLFTDPMPASQPASHTLWVSFKEGVVWNIGRTREDVETGAEIVRLYREVKSGHPGDYIGKDDVWTSPTQSAIRPDSKVKQADSLVKDIQDARDAARYRWLRRQLVAWNDMRESDRWVANESMDDAIDAAAKSAEG